MVLVRLAAYFAKCGGNGRYAVYALLPDLFLPMLWQLFWSY